MDRDSDDEDDLVWEDCDIAAANAVVRETMTLIASSIDAKGAVTVSFSVPPSSSALVATRPHRSDPRFIDKRETVHRSLGKKVTSLFAARHGITKDYHDEVRRIAMQRHLVSAERLALALFTLQASLHELSPVIDSDPPVTAATTTKRQNAVLLAAPAHAISRAVRSHDGTLFVDALPARMATPTAGREPSSEFARHWAAELKRHVAGQIRDDIERLCVQQHTSWKSIHYLRYHDTPDAGKFWSLTASRVALALGIRLLAERNRQWWLPGGCFPPYFAVRRALQHAVAYVAANAGDIGQFEPRDAFAARTVPTNAVQCYPQPLCMDAQLAERHLAGELKWLLARVEDHLNTNPDTRRRVIVVPPSGSCGPLPPLWKALAPVWQRMPVEVLRAAVVAQRVYWSSVHHRVVCVNTLVCTPTSVVEILVPDSGDMELVVTETQRLSGIPHVSLDVVMAMTKSPSRDVCALFAYRERDPRQIVASAARVLRESLFVGDMRCRYVESRRVGNHMAYPVYDRFLPLTRPSDVPLLAHYTLRLAWSCTGIATTAASSSVTTHTSWLWAMLLADEPVRACYHIYTPEMICPLVDTDDGLAHVVLPQFVHGQALAIFGTPLDVAATTRRDEREFWFFRYVTARYRKPESDAKWKQFVWELATRMHRLQGKRTAARVATAWLEGPYKMATGGGLTLRDVYECAPPAWWQRNDPRVTECDKNPLIFRVTGTAHRMLTAMVSYLFALEPAVPSSCDKIETLFEQCRDRHGRWPLARELTAATPSAAAEDPSVTPPTRLTFQAFLDICLDTPAPCADLDTLQSPVELARCFTRTRDSHIRAAIVARARRLLGDRFSERSFFDACLASS
jgi:hypothetical protein